MTRRAVADEHKYYDFEIALTVDPIWCEEDEDGPRIDYRVLRDGAVEHSADRNTARTPP